MLAAEKFAAINYALGYADYPQRDLDLLWKKLIESMDHNHDGQGGALADGRKAEYEQLSIIRGGEILRDSLRNIAERVRIPIAGSLPIVVFNPLGWSRDDVVRSHVALFGDPAPADIAAYKKGMRLLDEAGQPVPFYVEEYSENISRALQLVFVAKSVPSLGYRTYYLVSADQPETRPAAAQIQLDSDKDLRDPRRALGADTIENKFYRVTVDRATGRVTLFDMFRLEQLFPVAEAAPVFEYGVPFGANRSDNMMPNTGTHQQDEIPTEDWKSSRHIHDWIHAGAAGWGLTIATDHQQIRLAGNLVRAEMVRGTRFTSVKVVRGEEAGSPHYPPAGTYVFHYSLSSAAGDWKSAKAWRTGMAFTNPLLPVSVVDSITGKSLPPVQSYCSVDQEDVVISAIKKSDADSSVLLRVYEIEGRAADTAINFLGAGQTFTRTNLLEEDIMQQGQKALQLRPYEISSLKVHRPEPRLCRTETTEAPRACSWNSGSQRPEVRAVRESRPPGPPRA